MYGMLTGNGCGLRVYTVGPAKALYATPSLDTFPEYSCVCVSLLPPAKDGRFVQIRQLASQRVPPVRPGGAPAFEHDTQLAILTVCFYTGSEPPSVLARGRQDEEHTLVVPISALLAHTSPSVAAANSNLRAYTSIAATSPGRCGGHRVAACSSWWMGND